MSWENLQCESRNFQSNCFVLCMIALGGLLVKVSCHSSRKICRTIPWNLRCSKSKNQMVATVCFSRMQGQALSDPDLSDTSPTLSAIRKTLWTHISKAMQTLHSGVHFRFPTWNRLSAECLVCSKFKAFPNLHLDERDERLSMSKGGGGKPDRSLPHVEIAVSGTRRSTRQLADVAGPKLASLTIDQGTHPFSRVHPI